MYNLMDSNVGWIAVLYSILLVVIGAFFLLNVILAVLAEALKNVEEIEHENEALQNAIIHQSLVRRKKQDEARVAAGLPQSK